MKKLMLITILSAATIVQAAEYHVAKTGNDSNKGTQAKPFLTIQKAADVAHPGDVITVHAGTYRERINPPIGGTSDAKRITYQSAKGEKVVIKGSEAIKGWENVQNDTWKVSIPNRFFGEFNPYSDLIRGDWFNGKGRQHHTGAVYLNEHWLIEAAELEDVLNPIDLAAAVHVPEQSSSQLWFAQVNDLTTTIWAQFKDINPNEANVEINVRQSVFYPDKPGRNYITVRGFAMMHAATNWAPPTAEQVGLIGTHWSKGWLIEDNDIRYSVCAGVTLGKHGDEFDNTSANSAEGYVKTIERGLARGWSKANIGSHIVCNNHISHCEQAGIVGSLGSIFSTITGNTIHDIHIRQLFTGAEMAGIKFHGAVDAVISNNHIYRTTRGIWLDWMTQGTRVTCNLLHDNGPSEDLFVEVNHGPFLVDNNIFLSRKGILTNSQGAAYVHNLVAGRIHAIVGERRQTPYLKEHSTEVVGLAPNPSGDERYYNNIFVNGGLEPYDKAVLPVFIEGNVALNGAKPSKHETGSLVQPKFDPDIKLVEEDGGVFLYMNINNSWSEKQTRKLVTTDLLGKAKTPDLPYVQPDGSPYSIDTDYFGKRRHLKNPTPGPFEKPGIGRVKLNVWPLNGSDEKNLQ